LVQVEAVQQAGTISARRILEAISAVWQRDIILLEGGPQLIGISSLRAAWMNCF
jgi:hypothetical protein